MLTPRRNGIDEFEAELLANVIAGTVVLEAAMRGGVVDMDPCDVVVGNISGRGTG